MNTFIKIDNDETEGFPLVASNLLAIFPELEGKHLTKELLDEYAYAPFFKVTKPTSSDLTKQYIESTPVKNGDGVFVQSWEERAKVFATEEDKQTAITATNAARLSDLREKRNALIKATDAYALQDVILTNDMKTYRQALRDLPANTSDLENITWPTAP